MSAQTYSFGDFELDPSRFELRRNGNRLRIERIPLELLILLIERDGQVVSRPEIIERLWGKDVFLDTEHGINTAIRKVRFALRDDPDSPRFIQTVPGKGYRFLTESLTVDDACSEPAEPPPAPSLEPNVAASTPSRISSFTRQRFSPGWIVAGAALVLVVGFGILLLLRSSVGAKASDHPVRSIAVLPLANVSGDPAQDYFADGMTDELITRFAQNTPLRVVSRTTVMQYKNAKQPLHEIARELGVDAILEGSASRTNDRVHMTVQLIYAPTDSHLWAESYDSTSEAALQLPADISAAVARRLKSAVVSATPVRPVNPDAHDAYLRGRYYWFNGNDGQSQQYFEKAIELQPDYAPAWAGLSSSYAVRAIGNKCLSSEVIRQTESTARKAIELDPNLPEAHHVMAAFYLFYAWDPVRADIESRRSIELDPSIAEQHHLHSYILFALNRVEEALQEQARAAELDPFERPWAMGRAYMQAGRLDDAIKELRMSADANPTNAGIHWFLAQAYFNKKMYQEWLVEIENDQRITNRESRAKALHNAYMKGGQRAVRQWELRELQDLEKKQYVSAYQFAQQYALLQERQSALRYLKKCLRNRDPWLVLVQSEPAFNFLHDDPRYQSVIRAVGLQLR